MPLFRITDDVLSIMQETSVELESRLEDWLESSPWAIAQEPLLWIGRQSSASVGDGTIFPDLLGVDSEGNLVIVELKKERAPRDVMAQLLEYAAWANELSEEQIQQGAEDYIANRDKPEKVNFADEFRETFEMIETDVLPKLNRNLRLFIVGKEIPMRIHRVCELLRNSYGMDISLIEFSIFKNNKSDEALINLNTIIGGKGFGDSKLKRSGNSDSARWSADISVRDVVWNAVQELTKGNKNSVFTMKELKPIIERSYPNFNMKNLGPEIHAYCVNSPSRKHYLSGGNYSYYWQIERGKFRLFDQDNDK